MAAKVDFIQENIPEQLPLKQRILAQVSRVAAPDVIIASSTSGLMPTDLQKDMTAPERLIVGHPFNPVYLLPLVESSAVRRRLLPASKRRRSSTPISVCMRYAFAAKCRAISPIVCRKRSGAKFCTW
jgi:hypothetical protein